MGIRSAQGKSIRRRASLIGLVTLIAYTAVFALAANLLWDIGYQKLAYKIADITSPWNYVTSDEYTELYLNQLDSMQSEIDAFVDEHSPKEEWEKKSEEDSSTWDDSYTIEDAASLLDSYVADKDIALWSGKGLYAWRDLTIYHAFLDAKPAALAICYLLGLLLLSLIAIPRLIKQVDSLAFAISGLFADKSAPIALPKSLTAARTELVDIQNRELHNEQAVKAAEQRKNELVAYLAHDIRTPLTSVIGYLDILRSSPELPDKERAKFAGIAYEKAERLDVLMEEFFEITRYNLQSIPIEREQIDLKLFCQQVAEAVYPQSQARGLSVKVQAPEKTAVFIDPEKMARASSNILRNAIAYSNDGGDVTITAYSSDNETVIEIADHGKEISPEHLETIFEKFFREDAARSANKGGAGLGLAIAKEIVEAHGGTITATSVEGLTTFKVELPDIAR